MGREKGLSTECTRIIIVFPFTVKSYIPQSWGLISIIVSNSQLQTQLSHLHLKEKETNIYFKIVLDPSITKLASDFALPRRELMPLLYSITYFIQYILSKLLHPRNCNTHQIYAFIYQGYTPLISRLNCISPSLIKIVIV